MTIDCSGSLLSINEFIFTAPVMEVTFDAVTSRSIAPLGSNSFALVGNRGSSGSSNTANGTSVTSFDFTFDPNSAGETGAVSVTQSGADAFQLFSFGGTVGARPTAATGVANDPPILGEKRGSNGGAGGSAGTSSITLKDLEINLSLGSNGKTDLSAVSIENSGGSGGNGNEAKNGFGFNKVFGGNGGSGASGGSAVITVSNVTATANATSAPVIEVLGLGGNGGKGGRAVQSASSDRAQGGAGGSGGRGADLTFTADGPLTLTADTNAVGVFLSSRAGSGGTGGKGQADFPLSPGFGGTGGNGGSGGDVALTSSGTVTISTGEGIAIRAESIGGAGGNGGESKAPTGTSSNGGNGGEGGRGGTVSVDMAATAKLTTTGAEAHGIFVRSYGGDGGNGGSSSGGFSGKGGASVGPGPAGDVSVSGKGTVNTSGDEANAIIAQSVGGFSGNAGTAKSLVTYGSNAQSSGGGGSVSVTWNQGTLRTKGEDADAIFAQSVGGGGGRGSSGQGLVALGSSGSAGGSGGKVSVAVTKGKVKSDGDFSNAIHAASVGGGGGDGGGAAGLVSIGGAGAQGGGGGDVTITNGAAVTTLGDTAFGLFAQSVGNGGGSAKLTGGAIAIGGMGGGSASSGDVMVANSGAITTSGDNADAVVLESQGGGGGNGANATAVSLGFALAIGGRAGSGGDGGSVSYSDEGSSQITTSGDNAEGLLATSNGGGGGNGGSALSISALPAAIGSVSVALGGSGGSGGKGGSVVIDQSGSIETKGANATGLFAQSNGGGGGNSGTTFSSASAPGLTVSVAVGGSGGDGGDGGSVSVTKRASSDSGTITTFGANADGLVAKSLGGGGGTSKQTSAVSGFSLAGVNVAVGGRGGGGGDGKAVTVTSAGSITTAGALSTGLKAVSQGGGGGTAALTISGTASPALGNVNLAFGGSGGKGGAGGAVEVTSSDAISTEGDLSSGLVAQSTGGGGGNGGVNVTATTVDVASIGFSLGGTGGSGGSSSGVKVNFDGAIDTLGDFSSGLVASSQGGGGGNAGMTVVGNLVSAGAIDVNIGGAGGTGGVAGLVDIDNSGSVTTAGQNAPAIIAESRGGGGGIGGLAISPSLMTVEKVTVTIGGKGGDGGAGKSVDVTNEGDLTTGGVYATGISAVSQGGSGGRGGFAGSGALATAVEGFEVPSINVTFSVGGNGGDGGTGSNVSVVNSGTIATADYGATGIAAQSVGGDGGSGGSSISIIANVKTSNGTLDVETSMGGEGGDGGTAGKVTIDNSGAITTDGYYADAILAQSIGGNGGVGGDAKTLVAFINKSNSSFQTTLDFGGPGGSGSIAGDVMVTNTAALITDKGGARGIYAQSIGGNGGKGGSASNINLNIGTKLFPNGPQPDKAEGSKDISISGEVLVGGDGGGGSHGGDVTVENEGEIITRGDGAHGIFAESIGGNGGDGGPVASASYSINGVCTVGVAALYFCNPFTGNDTGDVSIDIGVSFQIGGSGGTAANGGAVQVTNKADISTAGQSSDAIFAQSIGGGGGTGGYAGAANLDLWGATETIEDINSYYAAISAQPWNELLPLDWTIAIGGNGGGAGDGSTVSVSNSGALTTTGEASYGIFAQSVGGGGGSAGKASGFNLFTNIVVGGQGSAGGTGAAVEVNNTGQITTAGRDAIGIFAQSVGGGGGDGGSVSTAMSFGLVDMPIGFGIAVPGEPGEGGDGGDVTVMTSGAITTSGELATGIFAQSVGGGGGAAGASDNFTALARGYIGNTGDDGNGGVVTVTVNEAISVSGAGAHGVFAQSVGGPNTQGGAISIALNADVAAKGANGRGLLVQSDGGKGGGALDINIASGVTLSSAAAGHEALAVLGGKVDVASGISSEITNNGTITKGRGASDSRVSGYTLAFRDANISVTNNGVISGSTAWLGSSEGTLFNGTSGLIEFGSSNVLAKGGFTNQGRITAGGLDDIATASFTAADSQAQSNWTDVGTLVVDYQLGDGDSEAPAADRLAFTKADFAATSFIGTVEPNTTGVNLVDSGTTGRFLIVSGANGTFSSTVEDSAIVDWGLTQEGANVYLTYETSHVPWEGFRDSVSYTQVLSDEEAERANDNLASFGVHIDDLVAARIPDEESGSEELAWVDDLTDYLLGVQDIGELVYIYESWTPQIATAPLTTALFSSIGFASSLRGCPLYDERGSVSGEEQDQRQSCLWVRAEGGSLQRQRSSDSIGYTENAFGFEAGFQMQVADGLFAGAGFLFEDANLKGDGAASGSGKRYQGGLVMRKEHQSSTFTAALTGGVSNYDLSRSVVTPNGERIANSSADTAFVTGWLGAAHAFVFDDQLGFTDPYLKPVGDVGLIYQWQGSYSETGAGDYGARIEDLNQVFGVLNPHLEAGATVDLFGLPMKSYVKAGALTIIGGNQELTAAFAGTPEGGPTFTVSEDIPPVFADLGFGVEVDANHGLFFRIEGNTLLAGRQQSYYGSGRVGLRF